MLALLLATAIAPAARAGPNDAQTKKGLALAKKNDCLNAVPLLEEAELAKHKPTTAAALAGCYVALGELIRAAEMYHAIADEKPAKGFTQSDRAAIASSGKKADELDERIPTLAFKLADTYKELEVEVDGHVLEDPEKPRQVPADVAIAIVARARGRKDFGQRLVLNEGDRKTVTLRLDAAVTTGGPAPDEVAPPPPKKTDEAPTSWFGARFRGMLIPQFVMNAFGEGGTTVYAPGGGLTFTTAAGKTDVVLSLAYASYSMGPTPFKPAGTPNTEYEIIESDLQSLYATVDLMWSVPLDSAAKWSFRFGGGVGLGWTFLGNLYRTQAYPPKGAGSDPYKLKKCKGPNNPSGTYAYCNQLDKDADHYGNFAEPSWFEGGSRPLIYPWLAFPQLGLTWKAGKSVAVDFEVGVSLSGFVTGFGMRWGLGGGKPGKGEEAKPEEEEKPKKKKIKNLEEPEFDDPNGIP